MNKQSMICLAFLCLAVNVFAQNATMTFLFPIEEVSNESNIFFAAENFGFEVDTKGEIQGLYDKNDKERNQTLGTATITKVDGITVYFSYELQENASIKKSDLIAFEIDIPTKNQERILYKMFALNIKFLDVYDKYLFEGFDFGKIVAKTEEKTIMNALLEEIHFVGEAMKEQSGGSPKVTEAGRFGELTLFDAMQAATYEDLYSFLKYIEARPLKYQGQNWRISEVFATWIDAGTPTVVNDVSDLLLNAKTETDILKYSKNISDETIEEITEDWRSQAEDFADNGNFDKAFELVNQSMKVGQTIKNQEIIAWSNYNKGYLFSKEENDKKAIEYYEKAKSAFEKDGNKAGVVIVGTNIGNALNSVEKYELALKYLKDSYKAHQRLLAEKPENEVLKNVGALILKNQGDSYVGLEHYKKAQKQYETALTFVKNPTSDKGITRKASIYFKLSELHEILGNTKLSEDYSQKATDLITEMLWNN